MGPQTWMFEYDMVSRKANLVGSGRVSQGVGRGSYGSSVCWRASEATRRYRGAHLNRMLDA